VMPEYLPPMMRISQVDGRSGVERCSSSSWSSVRQNGRAEGFSV
jgi:hypothetical protein